MIIIVNCHGRENGKFPIFPKDNTKYPERILFYNAVKPGNTAGRITDVNARNLLLNRAALDSTGATPVHNTNGSILDVSVADFMPNVQYPFISEKQLCAHRILSDTLAGMPNSLPWDQQTCRLFPDAMQTQNPQPDYDLEPYTNENWTEFNLQMGIGYDEKHFDGVIGKVVCVNSVDNEKLSDVILRTWREHHLKPGLLGPVAVICLFCRSK